MKKLFIVSLIGILLIGCSAQEECKCDNEINILESRLRPLEKYYKEFTLKHERTFILKQLEIPHCKKLLKQLEIPNEATWNQPCNYEVAMSNVNMMTNFCLEIYDKLKFECDIDYWDYFHLLK